MHACTARTKRLRHAVADAAGSADDKHLLAAEIEFVHP
jgi:hypothetical protein